MKIKKIAFLLLSSILLLSACSDNAHTTTKNTENYAMKIRYLEAPSAPEILARCEFPDYSNMLYITQGYSIIKGKVNNKQEIAIDYQRHIGTKTQTNYYILLTIQIEEIYRSDHLKKGNQLIVAVLTSDREEWRCGKYLYETDKSYYFFLDDSYETRFGNSSSIHFKDFCDAVEVLPPIFDLLMTENCQVTDSMARLLNHNAEVIGCAKQFTAGDALEESLRNLFKEIKQ